MAVVRVNASNELGEEERNRDLKRDGEGGDLCLETS
jgi:hypothetical protein